MSLPAQMCVSERAKLVHYQSNLAQIMKQIKKIQTKCNHSPNELQIYNKTENPSNLFLCVVNLDIPGLGFCTSSVYLSYAKTRTRPFPSSYVSRDSSLGIFDLTSLCDTNYEFR